MTTKPISLRSKGIAALLSLAITVACYARASEDTYHFGLGDDTRSYRVDSSRVRIVSDSKEAPQETVASTLEEKTGLALRTSNRYAFKGESFSVTELEVRAEDYQPLFNSASQLPAEGRLFVSPVFIDDRGLDAYLSPRLMVAFLANTPERQREQVLNSIPLTRNITLISKYRTTRGENIQDRQTSAPQGLNEEETAPGDPWDIYLVELATSNGFDVLDAAHALKANPHVTYVSPDFALVGFTAIAPPNDALFSQSWHLEQSSDFDLNALTAWDTTIGYSSVKVAVLDGGIQTNHPDLSLSQGQNFSGDGSASNYGPANAHDNHATAVAGTINARINNSIGTAGIAPGVQVVPCRFYYNVQSNGSFTYNPSAVVNALDWAVGVQQCRVTVFSVSLASNSAITNKLNQTRANDLVLHVAASGNSGGNGLAYPASLTSVVAVGAAAPNGTRASFSTYGTGLALMGPGEEIITTDRTGSAGYVSGNYVQIQGTSFATPLVAGVAALLLSKNPGQTPAQVQNRLQNNALDMDVPGYDTMTGHGLVRANLALAATPAYLWHKAGIVDLGDGWKWHSLFGFFNDTAYPWWNHAEHGYQYSTSNNLNDIWFFDQASGHFFWTQLSPQTYPDMVRDDGVWFHYDIGSSNPRWFYNYSTGQWVNF